MGSLILRVDLDGLAALLFGFTAIPVISGKDPTVDSERIDIRRVQFDRISNRRAGLANILV